MTDDTDVPDRLAPDPARIADGAEFARELTLARRSAGLTVRQVQQATGVVASTLGGWFAGRHSPNPAALDAILRACGIDDPLVVAQWHEALGRVRKVPGRRRPRTSEPPYRGLESFRPEDASWFFGRAALVAAVVATLRDRARRGLLVVVGASGAGKSSLLRAGVMAALGPAVHHRVRPRLRHDVHRRLPAGPGLRRLRLARVAVAAHRRLARRHPPRGLPRRLLRAVTDRDDLARLSPDELAARAEAAIEALARSGDPAAFGQLLRLTRVTGEAVGVAARTLADAGSWTGVAEIAGTSRQAAWERWRGR